MNSKLLQQLINWPHCFISGTELKAMLMGTEDARRAVIKRAVHEGYLQRLRRDYYLIRNITNKPMINMFELAQLIYGPSYISFESALSYHNWIPERVSTTCSATIKQSKSFNTPVGEFSFEKIPNDSFKLGVAYTKEENTRYLMADPWKAIADMIYCRKKRWESINDLMFDLRIEEACIKNHKLGLLAELSNLYPHKFTRQTLQIFFKELKK
ncbi:MAG: hypothetical protein COV52_02380 [Gammaproteobacteria bacterium CG11_big_fil_rev_8_21_14_0_20_46_22]|nr:MAG: hypothetical protein COW05_08420 [Gammaproteobacteria bacterium CG12_big_fil_rev_8_21_14_0_65_46_12]PIR11627.1 MAG: hypothetical protein COV52_02380 [Gammaproteobacteria bacterium CG11_big_fil_rev_8_21_14_0_20_46_22]